MKFTQQEQLKPHFDLNSKLGFKAENRVPADVLRKSEQYSFSKNCRESKKGRNDDNCKNCSRIAEKML